MGQTFTRQQCQDMLYQDLVQHASALGFLTATAELKETPCRCMLAGAFIGGCRRVRCRRHGREGRLRSLLNFSHQEAQLYSEEKMIFSLQSVA